MVTPESSWMRNLRRDVQSRSPSHGTPIIHRPKSPKLFCCRRHQRCICRSNTTLSFHLLLTRTVMAQPQPFAAFGQPVNVPALFGQPTRHPGELHLTRVSDLRVLERKLQSVSKRLFYGHYDSVVVDLDSLTQTSADLLDASFPFYRRLQVSTGIFGDPPAEQVRSPTMIADGALQR